jgi:hypothetical protein
MTWEQLSTVVQWAMLIFFFSAAGAIVIQMLNGRIILTGLLGREKGGGFRFHRLQLLVVTLIFAGGYLARALAAGPGEPLPDVPTALLLALLGSQGAYLGGKAQQLSQTRGSI